MPDLLVLVLVLVAVVAATVSIVMSIGSRRKPPFAHRYTIQPPHPEQPTLCDAIWVGAGRVHRCFLLVNNAGAHSGSHIYGNDPILNLDPADPVEARKRIWLEDISNTHRTNLRQEYPNE